jgi:murein L,D-transpeptidase YcbB/YkuD
VSVRAQPRCRARRRLSLVVVAGVASLVLTSCGDDGDTELNVAEARVAAKEKAVSSAQSAADEAAATFCDASSDYITALDRYGDVLNATTPTVGDVKDAGSDLAEPREEAVAGAEAAVSAQQALVTAEQELAAAEAALAEVTAGPDGTPATSTPTAKATPAPLVPSKTVARVEQAETDLAAAQEGISDTTPLAQASQQFNAAAVAVEMSWLRLYADAGCLTDKQQKQAEAAVRDYTVALQEALASAGFYDGDVDGVYGPATVDAVEALQQEHGLPVTGTVDKATEAALQTELDAKGGAAAEKAVASTAAVQQTLKLAGYWDGPVDGDWTPELTEALKEFQTALGVEPSGTVDAATVAALEEALADPDRPQSDESAPSSPSPDGSTSAPSTSTSTSPA